ncbi:hypothetical protein DK28_0207435 [Peptococcaceae bacterium SCADC1_2_3]|nr:hypothetical protein DK28_0207435 [Peptococcaceae bacterium SCADC1_2_3]KFI35311.1 hypothetical protein HY00_05675 [Peptococcaceae bacterium SCADC1_2_3]
MPPNSRGSRFEVRGSKLEEGDYAYLNAAYIFLCLADFYLYDVARSQTSDVRKGTPRAGFNKILANNISKRGKRRGIFCLPWLL